FKKPEATDDVVLYSHNFEIQEFRTPEFEVSAELGKAAPYVGQQPIHITAKANYYAGGGLAAAPVTWRLNASRETYTPPNQGDWSFGFSQPIWWRWGGYLDGGESVAAEFTGKTDSDGKHQLVIQPKQTAYPLPISVSIDAAIADVNRQEWNAESKFLLHPANTYVGLKTASYFVEQAQPLDLDLITVDIDGQAVANSPVRVEAGWIDYSKPEGKQVQELQSCLVQTDAKGLAHCQFKTEKSGQYRITALTLDSEGRRNASRITRWVSGDMQSPPTTSTVEMETARIIPDKDSYAPNETAKLLIQSPFKDAEGLLLVNHDGLVTEQRFTLQGNSHTLELPLKPEWLPNVNLSVNLVGQTPRRTEDGKETKLPERPAMASADLVLKISKAERVLTVKVKPQTEVLAPAEATPITVQVQNAKGEPVANAEVALVVADEAILTAGAYQLTDPLDTFYPESSPLMMAQYFRSSILLPVIPEMGAANGGAMLAQAAPAPRAAMVVPPVKAMGRYRAENKSDMRMYAAADAEKATSPSGSAPSTITARTNFNPLAAFVPNLVTDAQGQVTTMVKLPDNLTRYRIMAVAAQDATHYGKGESHLTARKELMVRPSAPRFLNFGDSFELPVVLQNQSDQPMSVQVALGANNLELTQAKGYALEIPANDRVEVRFPAKTINVGQVDYQIAAATSTLNDAATGSLPVWTPATSEAFATYGVVDQGAVSQAIETPKQVLPQFGELKITTSSTALQSLSDAFIYLQNYPYSCSEQIASRMLSTAALKDVLQAFKTKDLPSPEAIEQSMQRDLENLAKRQTGEGGFSLWGSGSQDWPYANVHVAHALIRAKEKGYKVDQYMLEQSMNYLKNIEQHFPKEYSPEVRRYIKAYSLYVRQLVGDEDPAKAQALIKQEGGVTKLSTEALGWLLNVLASHPASAKAREELLRELMNRTQETAAGATLRSDFGAGDYWVMHSDRTANGIVLEALIKAQPKSDLIPKLVKGIQTERTQGHWGTTQANAFILLGLDKYFQQYEAQTPDFVAKAWLGNDFAGEQSFKGRSMDSVETDIPMAWLLKGEQRRDLVLDKQGAGRLYYRIGLKYAPESLDLAAMEQGFSVTRSYRGLDNAEDVKQRADGTWQVKAGARVEVNLTMLAPAERHHVALVDALPAGFEAVNPALAVSAKVPTPEQPEPVMYSWMSTWYEYQNLRDERAEAFSSFLPDGVYNYSYVARATTP
ncbi:MAG TPA: alpha-2-macroglobulin family protein, partial [Thiolinea sp.]|nr:alpha-2-macroglobulin family protein [Thiolinea sp.]